MRILFGNKRSIAESLCKFSNTATVGINSGENPVIGSVSNIPAVDTGVEIVSSCLHPNEVSHIDAIGICQFDINTLGGILSLQGKKPDYDRFWELVAYVDKNGRYRIPDAGASEKDISMLYSLYAFTRKNKLVITEDGSVRDITTLVDTYSESLIRILRGDKGLLYDGYSFRKDEDNLNKSSFLEEVDNVAVRVSQRFTNHLYRTPGGNVAKCVVAYNTSHGKITISFSDRMAVSAASVAKDIWGDGAGGPRSSLTIAGSPNGQKMTLCDLNIAVQTVRTRFFT